ncbi:unnamed protein product, partial [Ectocarpus sp. 12 AP-2014]
RALGGEVSRPTPRAVGDVGVRDCCCCCCCCLPSSCLGWSTCLCALVGQHVCALALVLVFTAYVAIVALCEALVLHGGRGDHRVGLDFTHTFLRVQSINTIFYGSLSYRRTNRCTHRLCLLCIIPSPHPFFLIVAAAPAPPPLHLSLTCANRAW